VGYDNRNKRRRAWFRLSLAGLVVSAAAVATAGSAPALAQAAASQQPYTRVCSAPAWPGHMTCLAYRRTDIKPLLGGTTPSGYGPATLRSAYNLTATGSATQTVAIVDAFDDPNAESDLAVYRNQYGLPGCTTANGCFRKVNQNGGTGYPIADTGWAGEISLDLDMVSAICPGCHILLVEASSNTVADLGAAENEAVALGAKYISNSYGGREDSTVPSAEGYFNHPGVVITAASGDGAFADGTEYPASSQYVTAVGGTSLSPATNARGWTESAWYTSTTTPVTGSGSGCSTYIAKPSWQTDPGCSHRMVADVAAVADPATGVSVYQTYGASGWAVYGGTSAASPIIASVYALAGVPRSADDPVKYPYQHTSNLFDVTSGSTGSCSTAYFCTAQAGYDGPTGLGTPNGAAAFTPGAVSLIGPGDQSGVDGVAASLQIKASDAVSGQSLTYSATGLPAGLSIAPGTGLISGTPTTAGTFTVNVRATDTTGTSDWARFTWTIASNVPAINATPTGALGVSVLITDAAPVDHYVVNWSDNSTSSGSGRFAHTYARPGTYTITATAVGSTGQSISSASVSFTTAGADYAAYGPTRIMDTRDGTGLFGSTAKLTSAAPIALQVAGVGGIPATATAVAINLTLTNATGYGNVAATPYGAPDTTSNLNYVAGQTVPNMVIVPIASNGYVEFQKQGPGQLDLIADATGYFTQSAADGFTSVDPYRALDTRNGTGSTGGQLTAINPIRLKVAGVGTVPAGVHAVAVNLTLTDSSGYGNVAAGPAGFTAGTTSNLNYAAGDTIANAAIVPVDVNGYIDLVKQGPGAVSMILDVNGYFSGDGASAYLPATPARVYDTRLLGASGPLGPLSVRKVGLAHNSDGSVDTGVTAFVTNSTVTNTTGTGGFLAVFPDNNPTGNPTVPNVSTLNLAGPNETVPNLTFARPGTGGNVDYYNGIPNGSLDLIVDEFGEFRIN
jgi:hypothetical protein